MATTLRASLVLRRQWPTPCTSQLLVQSSLSKIPLSRQWMLSQQSPIQNVAFNLQQQRYQSDQFRPRAIGAFKWKKHSVPDDPNTPNARSLLINEEHDDVDSNMKQNDDGSPPVVSDSNPSDKSAGPIPIPAPTIPTVNVSNTTTPSNNDTDTILRNKEKTDVNQTIANEPNNANTADSNPWAHKHLHEFAPKIVVIGVGGAGTNAVNNMVSSGLAGVTFLALNTDAQHLSKSLSPTRLQIGTHLTSGLGCGANPDAGRLAAEESKDAIQSCIEDAHMVFITAGMGGGTGTGAAPVVAGICYDLGILTVSVVTTPFRFEGTHRMRLALEGVDRLKGVSDTLIVVPNQNLFRLVGETTSLMDSFKLADDVLLSGVRSITDLMTSPGMINLDFADVQSVMHGMGNALLGTGQAGDDEASGNSDLIRKNDIWNAYNNSLTSAEGDDENECRAIRAAKMALNNPLLSEGNTDIGSAKGMLVNVTGGTDLTLFEVDRAARYITERVRDPEANIIFGSAFDANLTGCVRVSVVATGIDEVE